MDHILVDFTIIAMNSDSNDIIPRLFGGKYQREEQGLHDTYCFPIIRDLYYD